MSNNNYDFCIIIISCLNCVVLTVPVILDLYTDGPWLQHSNETHYGLIIYVEPLILFHH